MSNNLVKEWSEFNKLQECPCLEDLLFVGVYFYNYNNNYYYLIIKRLLKLLIILLIGNPIHDNTDENEWKLEVHKRLPNLKKLDGEPIVLDHTF